MNKTDQSNIDRRGFLKTAAVTAGITMVKARSVADTEANSAIELGLIGVGKRGLMISKAFNNNGGYKFVALADIFEDRLQLGREQLGVGPARCYKGLEAYKDLIASKVDAVVIESPPYCHPEQAMAGVEAGKHVFLAKPVAIDVPGCRTIIEAGKKARSKVSFLVDFQTRAIGWFQEAARRVHQGAIGKPVLGQVYYHAPTLFDRKTYADPKDPSQEARLRNWTFDKALSGDIIVEQAVHVLDVANWYLKSRPIKAYGTGGRKARTQVGDCWDHFVCTFWYPNEVLVDFSHSQFIKKFADLCARIYGSEGTVDSHYFGKVTITGDHPWPGVKNQSAYKVGMRNNIKVFAKSVRSGEYLNNAEESAVSSLTTILGRIAAYEERTVTWAEMMKANKKLELNLKL
ncbi:MAG: Gfo/Idh/MocA family protein [Planctomycetota bacterium]